FNLQDWLEFKSLENLVSTIYFDDLDQLVDLNQSDPDNLGIWTIPSVALQLSASNQQMDMEIASVMFGERANLYSHNFSTRAQEGRNCFSVDQNFLCCEQSSLHQIDQRSIVIAKMFDFNYRKNIYSIIYILRGRSVCLNICLSFCKRCTNLDRI
ncbi:unnamed protein product, partial [Callosobruchus maculatus]